MRRIAKFHKVSKEQFQKDWIDTFGENDRQTGTPEDIYQVAAACDSRIGRL